MRLRRTLYLIITLAMILTLLTAAGASLAESGKRSNPPPIRLRGVTFTPQTGEESAFPEQMIIEGVEAAQAGYYLVQFTGPIQQSWAEALSALGVDVLDYVPDYAYKVRMSPAQMQQVRQMQQVGWVGVFQPAYKISPALAFDGPDNQGIYRVRIEDGSDAGQAIAQIARTGAQISRSEGNLLVIIASASEINAIARVADVAWIEDYVLRERHNEYGGGAILGANTANANGYDGSTQTVAIADTGLGDGTAAGSHPDIASRVAAIYDWPGADNPGCWTAVPDGPQDVDSGHGTHTSLSILSDGGPNGEGKGTAPAASLVFQAVEDWADLTFFCSIVNGIPDSYLLIGLPDDIRDLFTQAYNAGARIHSDSWGSSVAGEYTTDARNADEFIWSHPDMLITTSAGNAGVDGNGDGYVDEDSMGSPATAKNLLTVGASENDRGDGYPCDSNLSYNDCASQGGVNDVFTYGSAWPDDYPANPIAGDPSAGNAEQMAAFSSRGPVDDGRIKPDVVAPGTWVLSGYSDLYQEGYDGSPNPQNDAWQYDGWGFPLSATYKYMGGTSMSNPLVAGGAAVVRDYYQKAHGHNASAALTKATLINSAVDLLDENNDGANDNDFPIPNNHEGWGRVNLANATDGSHEWLDDANGVSTGGSVALQYNVNGGAPFKVTLVWSDYPSAETAAVNLVNDLDLIVTAPGGQTYRGNVFSGGWSQSGGSADRLNNIENVYIQSAQAGTWTVEVSGYNVPNGPQPFALVVDGAGSAGPTPTPTDTPTDTPVPPTPTDTPVPPTPTDTPIPPTPTDTPIPPTATPTDTPGPTPTDTPVPTDTPTPTATPTAVPPTPTPTPVPGGTMHVGDLDGSSTSVWGRWVYRASVTITVHDANENLLANATVDGSWNGSSYSEAGSCTTDSSGTCTIDSGYIRGNQTPSVTFTVDNVTHASNTYQPGDNHDPDGDSDGTSITIDQP